MTTTKTIQEDKLLMNARLLSEAELNVFLEFMDEFVQKKEIKESKEEFIQLLERIRNDAYSKGLTPEILEEILSKND